MNKSIMFVLSLMLVMNFIACGNDKSGANSLSHHAKDINQSDFDLTSVNWIVDNGEGLKILVDNNYLYLQFNRTNGYVSGNYTQFIIDIDNNTSTGNISENGADYIVENGYLYKSMSRDIWDWKEIGKVEIKVGEFVDTVKVDITTLENAKKVFSVNAEILDDKLKPILYSPSTVEVNGNHKKTVYNQ